MNEIDIGIELHEQEAIEKKIVHILGIYPIISPTMLQAGLGPAVKPSVWRPALADLVAAGIVVEDQESRQTPSDRYNTYSKLSLASNAKRS